MCNAYNHRPGCTCGWGGEGHLGRSDSRGSWSKSSYGSVFVSAKREWRDRDFTRPTTCPMCHERVFFIEHNGGCVWVDELGWPWPKHGCFDKPEQATYAFSKWSFLKASGVANPKLGVVTRLTPDADILSSEVVLQIRLNDSSRLSLVLRWIPCEPSLLGALVIISREDNLLLHPTYGEISFHSATELPGDQNGWTRCPRCKAWISTATFDNHESRCAIHYKPSTALRDSTAAIPLRRLLESRRGNYFTLAVDCVAQQAWETASCATTPEKYLPLARREALRLIRMLSPSIKGEIEHHFTSRKWEPLISRRPK